MKCDPGKIIELVDRGVEGTNPMKTDNEAIPRFSDPVRIGDDDEETEEKESEPFVPSKGYTESQVAQSLFPEKEVKEVVEEQMAIMNALAGSELEIPPWAKKAPDEMPMASRPSGGPFVGAGAQDATFKKRALLPQEGMDVRTFKEAMKQPHAEVKKEEEAKDSFQKSAPPPPEGVTVELVEKRNLRSFRPRAQPGESLAEREKGELEKFKPWRFTTPIKGWEFRWTWPSG